MIFKHTISIKRPTRVYLYDFHNLCAVFVFFSRCFYLCSLPLPLAHYRFRFYALSVAPCDTLSFCSFSTRILMYCSQTLPDILIFKCIRWLKELAQLEDMLNSSKNTNRPLINIRNKISFHIILEVAFYRKDYLLNRHSHHFGC